MKKIFAISILVFALLMGAAWWSKTLQRNDANIISTNGIHWHPKLAIYVKGEKLEIPANIGIGTVHLPVHTHEDITSDIIHLEFGSMVRKQDILLKEFFKSWNKDINSFGSTVKMTVNGEENTEFENYLIQEGDKIEIRYKTI